jgi:transposase
MGIRKYIVTLTSEERERLKRLVSGGQDKAYRIKHANLLLAADEHGPHLPSREIAEVFSCHLNTVTEVCQRFVEQGLEAALDRKKRATPPMPRKLDGRGEAQLIALACRQPPEGASHWALRLLADELVELGVVESISPETVRQVLKKTTLSRTCGPVG